MGAMSEPGIRRAARFGCPWPTDPLHNIEAGPSHELELEAIRRFGRDVIPAFKD
jgi:hypothetical protein